VILFYQDKLRTKPPRDANFPSFPFPSLSVSCFLFLALLPLVLAAGYTKYTHNKVEYDLKKVAWHYAKTWFVVDLISVVPVNYIPLIANGGSAEAVEQGNKTRGLRILRFAKLLKLLRLVRIKRIIDRYGTREEEKTLPFLEPFLYIYV
jgi:hypothetical protein